MCGEAMHSGVNFDYCMPPTCPFGRTEAHLPKGYETQADRLAAEIQRLTDWCDLMVDEFKRIRSCPESNYEIKGLCDRAIGQTKQNVPVIVQRNRAREDVEILQRYRDELKAQNEDLRKCIEDHAKATFGGSTSAVPWQDPPTLESIQAAVNKINKDFPSKNPMGICIHFTSAFTLSYPDSLGSSSTLLLQFNDRQERDAFVDALKKGKA
jgi:hypothetical protein